MKVFVNAIRPLGFCGFALLLTAGAATSCGGDDAATTTGAGGSTATTASSTSATSVASTSSGTGGAGGEGGNELPPCVPGDGVTLALTKLSWGQGLSGEWKKVGLNVDGLVSDATSTDLCLPAAGASPDTPYPDGDNGIDNSFGKNLLPIVLSVLPKWADKLNTDLETGAFNAMLKMYCLPAAGDTTDMVSKVFGGTALGTPPLYDGTDVWPVAPELLADPQDPESSTLVFEHSTVTGTLFDSGEDQTIILTIPLDINGNLSNLKLTLYSAQMVMNLSSDRRSATGGVIGGVLDTEEFLVQMKKIAWLGGLCDNALFDGLVTDVRRASDMLTDGTQDPNKECNGISLGVQFEMKEVQLGDVGPAAPVGMACP